jgi:transcriptional regulator with PAS, ATPase and Fis domain
MERILALSPGRSQLDAADLPDEIRQAYVPVGADELTIPDDGVDLAQLVADFERSLIRRALERTGNNKRQAADLLHVKRTTLIEKLKRLE